MTVQQGELAPWPSGPVRPLVAPRTWLATIHLLANQYLGVAAFTVVATGLALSFGLLFVALLGVLVFAALITMVRGYAWLERRRFALLLDVTIPDPAPPAVMDTVRARARAVVRSAVTWRQVAYCLLQLPLGTITATITLAVWSAPVALLLLPVATETLGPVSWLGPPLGALLLPAAPYVVRGLASADAAVARVMLGPYTTAELAGRVSSLERSRAQVMDAAEAERRRIERDLHDGAQQRLVSLAMTLGRAQARYEADPHAARQLLAEGHAEAKQALVELREITRGIHPPVLTDRGLDAALSGLAGRCPIPVTVTVEVTPRPSVTVEAIAYFVVAEALTNIAKHAHARCASVAVRRAQDPMGDTLSVVVLDDGIGGADPADGTGLAGLADRVSGVDGTLTLDTPPGGPTVLSVELPCEL